MKDFQIKQVHQNSCRFYGNISYDSKYDGIATSQSDEGKRVAELGEFILSFIELLFTVGDSEVMLQAHHGTIVCTDNLAVAFDHAYYIEQAAKVQVEWEKIRPEQQSLIEDEVAEATFKQLEKNKHHFAEVHLNAFLKKYALEFSTWSNFTNTINKGYIECLHESLVYARTQLEIGDLMIIEFINFQR